MLRRRRSAADPHAADRADRIGPIAERALLRAAATAAGHPVHLSVPREVQAGGFGPDALRFYVEDPPEGWGAQLVARVHRGAGLAAEAEAAADEEVAWHALVAERGIATPPILAREPESAQPAGGAVATGVPDAADAVVVIMGNGPEKSLLELIAERPMDAGTLMGRSGTLHAQLHDLDPAGAPGPGAIELRIELLDQVAARSSRQADWLRANVPADGDAVICHGDFQPTHVRFDPDAGDEPMLANWTAAFPGPAEWDVAITTLSLWAAPHLAPGRAQRMMLKMARDHLIDGYLEAYRAIRSIDEDLVAYYGALQAAAWAVKAEAGPVAGDPWDIVHLVDDPRGLARELDDRFHELTR